MNLVDDWLTQLRKAWSIRLAGIAGLVAAYFAAYPAELQKLIAIVPEEYRSLASLAVGLFVFATATGSRLVKQPSPPCPPEDGE